jgi:hypothetical protein
MSPAPDTNQAAWEWPEAVWQRLEPLRPPRQSHWTAASACSAEVSSPTRFDSSREYSPWSR